MVGPVVKVHVLTMLEAIPTQALGTGSQFLIQQYDDGSTEIAFRDQSWMTWSPPVRAEFHDGTPAEPPC